MPHERLVLLSSPKYFLRTDGGAAARLEERCRQAAVRRMTNAARCGQSTSCVPMEAQRRGWRSGCWSSR